MTPTLCLKWKHEYGCAGLLNSDLIWRWPPTRKLIKIHPAEYCLDPIYRQNVFRHSRAPTANPLSSGPHVEIAMCSILVVEDNAVFCGSLRDMLSHSLTSLSIDTALDSNEGF